MTTIIPNIMHVWICITNILWLKISIGEIPIGFGGAHKITLKLYGGRKYNKYK